jgi:hypothetical protein
MTSDLIDLIKEKTSDVLAQRKIARQLEGVGERVAESLLPIFEMDGARIPENGRKAVVLAVASTLDKAGIEPGLLAENNLEPRALASYLLNSDPKATRDFSSDETALYERIIQETSQYIIDIASSLPQFNERTFAEVLKESISFKTLPTRFLKRYAGFAKIVNKTI